MEDNNRKYTRYVDRSMVSFLVARRSDNIPDRVVSFGLRLHSVAWEDWLVHTLLDSDMFRWSNSHFECKQLDRRSIESLSKIDSNPPERSEVPVKPCVMDKLERHACCRSHSSPSEVQFPVMCEPVQVMTVMCEPIQVMTISFRQCLDRSRSFVLVQCLLPRPRARGNFPRWKSQRM